MSTVAAASAVEPPSATPLAAVTRQTMLAELPAVAALHDRVFGPGSLARTAYRIREQAGRPLSPFCRVSFAGGRLVAAIRLTEIEVGDVGGAALLGPLMIEPAVAGQGYGKALVRLSIEETRAAGLQLMLLVGNMSYYERFGFRPVAIGQIQLPGPVDLARLLAVELEPGALAVYRGLVSALRAPSVQQVTAAPPAPPG